jgi:hypothetical protein
MRYGASGSRRRHGRPAEASKGADAGGIAALSWRRSQARAGRLFFEFLAVTGLRVGEAIARDPALESMATRLLAHRRENYTAPTATVFATAAGTELDPHNVRLNIPTPVALDPGLYETVDGKDCKPRKRTTLGFHAFRDTCASLPSAHKRGASQSRRMTP